MRTILSISFLLFISGCGLATGTINLSGKNKQLKSQLEIRQMQTSEFQTSDTKMVLSAMLNTLQDEGYMVRQINTEMGFFNAVMEIDDENTFGKVWCSFWFGPHGTWRENSIVECTANVTLHGEVTRVRANFVVKSMNNRGGVTKIHTIEDQKFYQEFFSKVDKGIFIEKEKI